MQHAIASNLRGFASSTLRVSVTRRDGRYVWVTTADLLDVGTKLVLDADQVQPETPVAGNMIHRRGLVEFGGAA